MSTSSAAADAATETSSELSSEVFSLTNRRSLEDGNRLHSCGKELRWETRF